jgi:hypothetical protein
VKEHRHPLDRRLDLAPEPIWKLGKEKILVQPVASSSLKFYNRTQIRDVLIVLTFGISLKCFGSRIIPYIPVSERDVCYGYSCTFKVS